MQGNLLFSSLCATSFLLATTNIAASTGILEIIVQLIGFGLIGFVGLLWYGIQSKKINIAKLVVFLDLMWVVSSFAVLLLGWINLSTIGIFSLVSIAFIVAGFAIWQQQGILITE